MEKEKQPQKHYEKEGDSYQAKYPMDLNLTDNSGKLNNFLLVKDDVKHKLSLKDFVDEQIEIVASETQIDDGNSSQLATSGYYSQLATSGYYSQLATSGYYSRLASSGNSSQLATAQTALGMLHFKLELLKGEPK